MTSNTVLSLKFLVLISMLAFITGCAPQSKEAYMDDYEAFIEEVQEDHKAYSDDDWQEKDEQFKQYAEDWAKKFEEELTLTDQLKVAKHAITYAVLSAKQQTGGILRELLEDEDVQELKKELKYYADNEMEEDIEKIVEEAGKLGEEASKAVEEILKELDVEIKVEINERN